MLSGSFFKSKRPLLRPSRSETTDGDQTWIQLDEQTAGGEMLNPTLARKGDSGQKEDCGGEGSLDQRRERAGTPRAHGNGLGSPLPIRFALYSYGTKAADALGKGQM